MALFAFDGTWNKRKDGDRVEENTNVVHFHEAYTRLSGTRDLYVDGIGTRLRTIGRVFGGAFGLGSQTRTDEAYRHLCQTWADGDHVIDIVGFSRGAATSLDFCHLIQDRGIRRPGSKEVVEPEPQIRFLGLWDTVAAFGLGITGIADLNFGHRLHLPKERVLYACHALALDEQRVSFLPTRLTGACEVWFRGVHSDVGGSRSSAIGDISLGWMMRKAKAANLPIDAAAIAALRPDFAAVPEVPAVPLGHDIRHIRAVDRRHYSVGAAAGCRDMPDTCLLETTEDERRATPVGEGGIDTLPEEFRGRFETLGAVAEREMKTLEDELSFDYVRDALLGLIESRMPLVVDDAVLATAVTSVQRLVRETFEQARKRQNKVIQEVDVNLALSALRWPFPFEA